MDFMALIHNPAVQGILVLVALRLVPNEYLGKTFFGLGRAISLGGNKYLGRVYEEVVESTIGVCLRSLLDGMAANNKPAEPEQQ